jgi:threonine aldolase
MGGGMRQAGILAAAGIIALEKHAKLLAADHERAKKLALGLSKINGISVNVNHVDINMVFFKYERTTTLKDEENIVKRFAGHGIVINPPELGIFRFVTHYWIGDAEIEKILSAVNNVFANL